MSAQATDQGRSDPQDRVVVTADAAAPGIGMLLCNTLRTWRESGAGSHFGDILVVMTAAALPWSTTATTILIVLWIIVVIPIVNWNQLFVDLTYPACALPLLLVALALLGTLWSDVAWTERLHGIKPAAKLLLIPLLFYYFQRSQRGHWVFAAFLVSCTLLMALSWVMVFAPQLHLRRVGIAGVPVKDYIAQCQEFTLCAAALAVVALAMLRRRGWVTAIGCLTLIALFVANMLFVAFARTAMIYIPVLLALFVYLHLTRRSTCLLLAAAAVASILVWTSSPYLRQRITDIAIEYHQSDENNALASTAQRLTYWNKSIRFFVRAPVFGHGTGSTRRLFEQDAVGQTGVRAEVTNNPHNQTLNVAVQWGMLGIIALYAMWLSHVRLFCGQGLVAWIGLIVVAQNVVSSLFNSHLFDFHQGWIYVIGVGVAGGLSLRAEPFGRQ